MHSMGIKNKAPKTYIFAHTHSTDWYRTKLASKVFNFQGQKRKETDGYGSNLVCAEQKREYSESLGYKELESQTIFFFI